MKILFRPTAPMAYGRLRGFGTTLNWDPGCANGTWDYTSGFPKCVPNQSTAVPDAVWAQAADKIEAERQATLKAQREAQQLVEKATSPKTLTYVAIGAVALGAVLVVAGRMKRR